MTKAPFGGHSMPSEMGVWPMTEMNLTLLLILLIIIATEKK